MFGVKSAQCLVSSSYVCFAFCIMQHHFRMSFAMIAVNHQQNESMFLEKPLQVRLVMVAEKHSLPNIHNSDQFYNFAKGCFPSSISSHGKLVTEKKNKHDASKMRQKYPIRHNHFLVWLIIFHEFPSHPLNWFFGVVYKHTCIALSF